MNAHLLLDHYVYFLNIIWIQNIIHNCKTILYMLVNFQLQMLILQYVVECIWCYSVNYCWIVINLLMSQADVRQSVVRLRGDSTFD